MPELGEKFTCADCETKYYDLGRPDAVCPRCGSANRVVDEDVAAAPRASRSRALAKPVPPVDEPSTEEDGEEEVELDLSEVAVAEAEGENDEE